MDYNKDFNEYQACWGDHLDREDAAMNEARRRRSNQRNQIGEDVFIPFNREGWELFKKIMRDGFERHRKIVRERFEEYKRW